MEKFLGQDIPEDRRWQFLTDNADAVEKVGYTRRFSPLELSQQRQELADTSIQINDIEEEKKDAMAVFKDRLKPLTEKKSKLLGSIKTGSEFVEEECAKFIDYDEKTVGFYNKLGELVSTRPIMAQEMQKTIFNSIKTGTNNE